MMTTASTLRHVSGITSSAQGGSAWVRQASSSLAGPHLTLGPTELSEAFELGVGADIWTQLRSKDEMPRASLFRQAVSPKRSGSREMYLWSIASDSSQNLIFMFCDVDELTSPELRPLSMWREPTLVRSNTDAPLAPSDNPLVIRILDERRSSHVDAECEAQADAAIEDAISLVQRTGLSSAPNVVLSDDGILSLQWQKGELGVALLFAGDGIASIAYRRPGQLYANDGVDISVDEDLPESFKTMISAILS